MLIKSLMLYSLPYIAGVASSLVAAHQIAPSLEKMIFKTNDRSGVFFGQVVNRSLKGDRLPMRRSTSSTGKIYIEVPAQITPSPKINVRCERPLADVDGRCFANADSALSVT